MKTREGFVSNSSTTSFICGVCGDSEAYSDSCSLSDMDACQCAKCGESFHNDCIKEYENDENPLSKQEMLDALKKAWKYHDNDPYDVFTKNLAEIENEEEKLEVLKKTYENEVDDYDKPLTYCPVCSMKVISDGKILAYILETTSLTRESIENAIREKAKKG